MILVSPNLPFISCQKGLSKTQISSLRTTTKNFRTKVRLLNHYLASLSPCIPHFSYNETVTIIISSPHTFFYHLDKSYPLFSPKPLAKLNLFWRPIASYFVQTACQCCASTNWVQLVTYFLYYFGSLPYLKWSFLLGHSSLRKAHRAWHRVGTQKMPVALNWIGT